VGLEALVNRQAAGTAESSQRSDRESGSQGICPGESVGEHIQREDLNLQGQAGRRQSRIERHRRAAV
jgi:hypothetical protein